MLYICAGADTRIQTPPERERERERERMGVPSQVVFRRSGFLKKLPMASSSTSTHHMHDPNQLDRRLQDVLGHFWKDFDGEIASKKGPMFGEYGSFLPTYLRNPPIQSKHKINTVIQNNKIPHMLKKFEHVHAASANDSLCPRLACVFEKAPCKHFKQAGQSYLAQACEDCAPKHVTVMKESRTCDRKTLKIRIKVGVSNALKSKPDGYSSLEVDKHLSSSFMSSAEHKDGSHKLSSLTKQDTLLSGGVPINSPILGLRASICLKEKDDPSSRSSSTRIDESETNLREQPTRYLKKIASSPAFEGNTEVTEIHEENMEPTLTKQHRKGRKRCKMEDSQIVTEKRKKCSTKISESHLNENPTEKSGVCSNSSLSSMLSDKDNPSTRSSKMRIDEGETNLHKQPTRDLKKIGSFLTMEGNRFILEKEIHKENMKLKLTKRRREGGKRKKCTTMISESHLNENPTEKSGVCLTRNLSPKLSGTIDATSRRSPVTWQKAQHENGVTDVVRVPKGLSEPNNKKIAVKSILQTSCNNMSAQGLRSLVGNDYSHAATALKEATALKHSAGHLMNGESEIEATGIYLHAALKFLHAASMFEIRDVESAVLEGKSQSTQIYIETIKLCKNLAISFENCGEMGAAALAYKCIEIAYMRMVFTMSLLMNSDRHDLQASLHSNIFGQEWTQESASDVTNICEKFAPAWSKVKRIEPLTSRANCISPHLLNYVQYMSSAMDATRKSQCAVKLAQWKDGAHGVVALKAAMHFHFYDVEGFLRLARLALEEMHI